MSWDLVARHGVGAADDTMHGVQTFFSAPLTIPEWLVNIIQPCVAAAVVYILFQALQPPL